MNMNVQDSVCLDVATLLGWAYDGSETPRDVDMLLDVLSISDGTDHCFDYLFYPVLEAILRMQMGHKSFLKEHRSMRMRQLFGV